MVLSELQALPETSFLDADVVFLPVRAVSEPASLTDASLDERPPAAARSWPRWMTQVAVLAAFGFAGYAVSTWTSRDVVRSSAQPIPQSTSTEVGAAQPNQATRSQAAYAPLPKAAPA